MFNKLIHTVFAKITFVNAIFIMGYLLLLVSCDSSTAPLKTETQPKPKTNQHNTLQLIDTACALKKSEGITFKCYQALGAGLEYKVAILSPSFRNHDSNKSGLVLIPGGPGQGGMTSAASLESFAIRMIDEGIDRDLILYEPRGVLGSSQFWLCENYENLSIKLAGLDLNALEEMNRLDSVLKACLNEYDEILKVKDNSRFGLKSLNTKTYSDDLKHLLSILPYQTLVLWGTSYGTRLALATADHPKVDRLLLDSPYPYENGGFSDETELLAKVSALHDIQFEASQDSDINYATLFSRVYDQLKLKPIVTRIKRWDGEPEIDFVLNGDRLLALEFDALYDESLLALYYSGLTELALAPNALPDDLRIVLESLVTNAFSPEFSSMVFIATECNDNGIEEREQVKARLSYLNQHPFYSDYLKFFDMDLCHSAHFKLSHTIRNQTYLGLANKPSLILSGSLDPITPESWGRELHGKLNNAYWASVSGVGHSVLASYVCDWAQIEEFLEKGTSERLDCADKWLSSAYSSELP